MANKELNLCLGCMSELPEGETTCPLCGFREGEKANPDHLSVGNALAERYLTGKAVASTSRNITYIGFDTQEKAKVYICEYLPKGLAKRNHATGRVFAVPGKEKEFDAKTADYNDMLYAIQRVSKIEAVVPLHEIIRQNGTVYAVYQYIHTLTLGDFLTRCGGNLRWTAAKKFFMPLLTSLSNLHNQGIYHGHISPQTIQVDETGKLWLWDFAFFDFPEGKGELAADLQPGYCAPEQYDSNSFKGSWTDVYAVAAVLYRALTGTKPVVAPDRKLQDNLLPAFRMDKSIPHNVSDAIESAMILDVGSRTQNMDSFSAQLLEESGSNTAVYDSESLGNLKTDKDTHTTGGRRYMIITMVGTFVLLITILAVLANTLFPDLFIPNSPSSPSDLSELSLEDSKPNEVEDLLPDFVGVFAESILKSVQYTDRYDFVVKEEYNDQFREGVIFDQTPPSKTPMPNKGTVILYVSKGAETVKMPKLIGSTVEFAKEQLAEMNIKFEVVEVPNAPGTPGQVIETSIPAGEDVNVEEDTVIIYTPKDMIIIIN